MNRLENLLKQKSFDDLTSAEKEFVLHYLTAEDYAAERSIVLLSERLKQQQAHLLPNTAIKAHLLATMTAKNKPKWVITPLYRLAAGFIICLSLGLYFWQKNNLIKKETIENSFVVISKDNAQKQELILNKNNKPLPQVIKKRVIKQNKKIIKNKSSKNSLPNYEDIAFAFANKKTNFEWQEEEEEDKHTPSLICSDK